MATKKQYIVRTYSAGVHFGVIIYRKGKEVKMKNARCLYYWDGAATLSQLANEGVKKPENCKFPPPVAETIFTEVIQIIPLTQKAIRNLTEVPEWRVE